MHIYPQDYNTNMLNRWIDNAIKHGEWSIDIRFNAPPDSNNVNIDTKYIDQTDLAHNILGEISQTILAHGQVDGSISLGGTTATIYITSV